MPQVRMLYGSYEFQPVPLFSWTTETIRDAAFNEVFLRHSLDFTGTLLGTPTAASGDFDSIFTRRGELQQALASGQQEFRILSNNNIVFSVFPRVNNLSFAEGIWVDRIDYTFSLEYDEDFFNILVQSFNETWSFEEAEDRRTATARHDISAVGINTNPSGINNALQNAKIFVLGRTGYANLISGFPAFVQVSGLPFNAYEEFRTEQLDIQAGSYGAGETFTLSSGTFIHTFTGNLSQGEDGLIAANIEGNIKGLGRGDNAFARALSGWINDIKLRLPGIASGVYSELGGEATLFTSSPRSLNVTRNSFAGIVTYNISFSDSPSDNLPSGVQDFSLTVSDQKPIRLFASFAIPERALGNVVQDIATNTEGTFSIQGNAIGKQDFSFASLLSFVEDKINEKRPNPANYITLRLDQIQINKDEDNKNIQFNVSWRYTQDLSQTLAGDDDIILN